MFGGLKVLVTGCSGFLGPWLCQRLLDDGASVVGADIMFDERSRIHDLSGKVEQIRLDVQDFEAVNRLLSEKKIEFVFHLAAQAIVGVALEQPLETISVNVMGTSNILECARRLAAGGRPLKGILVASSDKAYGDQENLPYLEDAPMMGRFPYDVSKSCADLISRSYFHSFGLPICITRCGNLFGAGDLNFSRIVPGTIRSCLQGERPVIRSDGSLIRDYIYVQDAAVAMFLIGNTMLEDDTIFGEAFNISNDKPLSVIEIVDEIRAAMHRVDLVPVIENTARGEIKAQYLSSKRLRQRLGWAPQFTLREGLLQTIPWYEKHCRSENARAPQR